MLLMAPTGSGKTLAAFLTAIDRLMFSPEPPKEDRLRVLYLSPLKALGADVERNLRAPAAGVAAAAERLGVPFRRIAVAVRTGDTPPVERARFRREPSDVLITTPESLYLLLTSQARERLRSVETIIVDEIHAVLATKRGVHLALSLERLEQLRRGLLGGGEIASVDAPWRPRAATVVDASAPKALELRVETPVEDWARLSESVELRSGPAAAAETRASIWPSIYPRLVELVRERPTTLLFVNSRRLAERLAAALNEHAGEELALAHHGSLAREKRTAIEDRLKRGELRALVATSSLELGIDMGAVDLVVQIEAPPSIGSALQRVGRSGHATGETSRGVFFPKFRGDLLACAATVAGMREGRVEELRTPRNALDVLAQQLVAETVAAPRKVDDLYALVRRAAPYADLPRSLFDATLDLLSGRYPSDDFAELRPRLTWDRATGEVAARPGAARLAIVSGGVIPDRGLYGVFLAGTEEGKPVRVGELDEEMVFETRVRDVVVLGATSWRVEDITHDRVLVSPAPGEAGRLPFWKADRAARPAAFGRVVGALARSIADAPPSEAEATLRARHGLEERAARNLVAYVRDEAAATGVVPSDRTIVLERFVDELGDRRVVVLSPWGGKVHMPWCAVALARLRERRAPTAEGIWTEEGLAFRLPEADEPADPADFLFDPDELEATVVRSVHETPAFAAAFRENAGRALLLPKRRPGERTPLWMQRKRAQDLLAAAEKHPSFPIVLETVREVVQDVFDVAALGDLFRKIRSGEIRLATVDVDRPSPFAASVLFSWTGAFLYDGDAGLAERRAHALSLDPALLRDLLGEAELRTLLDPDEVAALERKLQRLDPPFLRDVEDLYDALRRLGDLSAPEIAARSGAGAAAAAWIRALRERRRAVALAVAGEERLIAAEDAARYRDALGVAPPPGLPSAFLTPVADPLGDLLRRYARTHGPFPAAAPAQRFGLGVAPVEDKLRALAAEGRVVEGAFLPQGRGAEWCDVEVLRTLKRRSLARLRAQVEPVDAPAFARFLAAWHELDRPRDGLDAVGGALERLEGCALPASAWFDDVLPARVARFRAWDVDRLCSEGALRWYGLEALGPHDGRVAFAFADRVDLLAPPPRSIPGETDVHRRVRDALAARGACFFGELAAKVGGYPQATLDALWDLVWAGEATNDTAAPLRARLFGAKESRSAEHRRASRFLQRRAAVPPGGEGRWSLLREPGAASPRPEERAAALAERLLDRHGVVTREGVRAEGVAGGFAAVYPVLRLMEERGQVRRGYFVAGLGGAQFARPGADERLRSVREAPSASVTAVLAATDPANPYGAAVPWPAGDPRPQRAAGAYVVLRDGALVAWLSRSASAVTLFGDFVDDAARPDAWKSAAEGLAALVDGVKRRALLISKIDGGPASASPFAAALAAAGFSATSKGLLRRAPRTR
ncbi:MAG TPA: DEAD/DEAH box helicase [Planctomycetota bacterium]|nr:DEAD/DEAH box helicase [Planctomycetota bacterium]